ncbi:hypothetical protein ACGF5M_00285 [Gemmatimonadota bacterium]
MNASPQEQKDRIFQVIESEKGRDRKLQRIATAAWILVFVALLFTAVGIGFNVWWAAQAFMDNAVGMDVIFREAMPFVWVAGAVSLLVAVLSTLGVFLRFRTASLAEIQLRLAALEEMLMDQAEAGHSETR